MERLFDLRFVIGAFFAIAGILLLICGFMENVGLNKACGAMFLLFGIVMIALTFVRPVSDPNAEAAADEVLH